ncbi:HlyU family transcriptional regulator [Thaumasiovibrio subtropicus]|uniref:HlyU family transcriptional regulator n=1 Tax=Thaumasiovibrio subtropicus TaxID=1891207 RepID=UPI000B35FD81|nr:HlyU family transcriptional regulator [Thaumasiovibrio subtropicus]
MGFLSKLFGKSSPVEEAKPAVEAVEYNGFQIYPQAIKEGGQYRIAGRICKVIDGEVKTHTFIRSDLLGSEQDANEFMLKKAQMFVDQTGDKMFS